MIRFATGMAGRASRTLLGSFGALIVLGTVLLSLPYATPRGGLPIIEALFMATSAVCVTGLTVMDVGAELTLYGQGVVLALIQLGALGLMTFSTVFFMMLGRSISFVSRTVARETLTSSGGSEVRSLIRSVVIFTLLFEMVGTAAFYFMFRRDQTAVVAFKNAVFHSVSAFCNAGFSLFSDSFVRWQSDSGMNTILISLIVCGGLGFVTLVDLWKWFSSRAMALIETARGRAGFLIERRALSVHSRMGADGDSCRNSGWDAHFLVVAGQRAERRRQQPSFFGGLFSIYHCTDGGFQNHFHRLPRGCLHRFSSHADVHGRVSRLHWGRGEDDNGGDSTGSFLGSVARQGFDQPISADDTRGYPSAGGFHYHPRGPCRTALFVRFACSGGGQFRAHRIAQALFGDFI